MSGLILDIKSILLWLAIIVAVFVGLVILIYLLKRYLWQKTENQKSKDRVLLLVRVPRQSGKREEQAASSKDLAILWTGIMEQFLSNLAGIYEDDWRHRLWGQEHLTFEIVSLGGEIFFYVSTPNNFLTLVEKQIHSFFHGSEITQVRPYNLFSKVPTEQNYQNFTAGAILRIKKPFIYPVRTYKELDYDSISSITTVLSKLGKDSTAAIQIIARPTPSQWQKKVESEVRSIQEDKSAKNSGVTALMKDIGKAAVSPGSQNMSSKEQPQLHKQLSPQDEIKLRLLHQKSAKVGFECKIRLLSVSQNRALAKSNLVNIISAFAQFNNPQSNFLIPKMQKTPKLLSEFVHDFILRRLGEPTGLFTLNVEELASIYHFPNINVATPHIKWLEAKNAPAPANLPLSGRILGKNVFRSETKSVRIKDEDRMRHIYAIGKTGTGKTTLYVNMAIADIKEGKGICYIDPHGDAVEQIMSHIPKERAEDVIYFNPADSTRPIGLNLLEWKTPEQKDFLVQEAVQMFYKLFDPGHTGIVGPQFEHWLRNASLTLMSYPEGGTLIEIPRLFTDKEFEKSRLEHVTDPVIRAFWEKQMKQTSEFHRSEMLNYFTSKFGRFMTNDMMRNIIGQTKSAFDFRDVMDSSKILLVNLSKGRIGEVNSDLLGMICVAKLQVAAMSRAEMPEHQRKPFYLYVDEFQNFTTEDFVKILSEARKYQLSLNITNQYIEQLPEVIRNAVFGNIGTLIAFRIGARDAEFCEREFDPTFTKEDLINIDKFNAYVKLLIDGVASIPFSMQTVPPPKSQSENITKVIRKISMLKYGKNAKVADHEIRERTQLEKVSKSFGANVLEKEPTPTTK